MFFSGREKGAIFRRFWVSKQVHKNPPNIKLDANCPRTHIFSSWGRMMLVNARLRVRRTAYQKIGKGG